MKVGTLRSWWPQGYGIISLSVTENYFLHVSNIQEMPEGIEVPTPGALVYFDVAAPFKEGKKFPQAVNARIAPPAPGAAQ
jgi:cold shock CspA family protein